MSRTLDIFQLPIGWLKDIADSNMEAMVVALDTSQPEISSLKLAAAGLEWSEKRIHPLKRGS
jgi:hypothetical protein